MVVINLRTLRNETLLVIPQISALGSFKLFLLQRYVDIVLQIEAVNRVIVFVQNKDDKLFNISL